MEDHQNLTANEQAACKEAQTDPVFKQQPRKNSHHYERQPYAMYRTVRTLWGNCSTARRNT